MSGPIIYLLPAYAPYRVPVLDTMSQLLKDDFYVLTLKKRYNKVGEIALKMGSFKRKTLHGIPLHFDGGKTFKEGKGSSGRILLTPTLPLMLLSLRPKAVISDGFSSWTILSILMGFQTVIFWEGTTHTERNIKPWKNRIRRWLAARAKSFVVNGLLAQEYLGQELGVDEHKILLGGMCPMAPPDDLSARQKTSTESVDRIKFLFCGQMNKRKGPAHLLKAAACLKHKYDLGKKFEVNLIGEGENSQVLKELVTELDIEEEVKLVGFVEPQNIWDHYLQNNVFVLPTLHDNWPLVIPEAMSTGMPVLLSKYAGSYPDLIVEDENGYVFNPDDEEMLAELMARYINEPDKIYCHGQKSLEIVGPYNSENAAQVALKALGV